MREIADLRAQVRQLQRDNAKLQVAPTPSSENPVEAPLEPSTSVKEASAKKEPNAKKETSEEAEGSEDLYVVTCFSDRDKLLNLPDVKKEG